MAKNRIKRLFDKELPAYEIDCSKAAKKYRAERKIATEAKIATRLFILSGVMFLCSCLLILSACIKFLFFI
tara:strand:+ start:335 stop:547 length:213 start_codon:yes stop_codon:yes gene_type:complete